MLSYFRTSVTGLGYLAQALALGQFDDPCPCHGQNYHPSTAYSLQRALVCFLQPSPKSISLFVWLTSIRHEDMEAHSHVLSHIAGKGRAGDFILGLTL